MNQQLIDKIGLMTFAAMSALILMCITIGFYAVYVNYTNMCGM